jgi:predicted nucleic acid-binding protein
MSAKPVSAKPRVFVDTNLLLYLLSEDRRKADIAERIIRSDDLERLISTQVVGEFIVNARQKAGLAWPEIRFHTETFRMRCSVAPVTNADQDAAIDIAEQYGYKWWDSQILATASRIGAEIIYSEDMQHGQKIGAAVIENPFR